MTAVSMTAGAATVSHTPWGKTSDGTQVDLYTLHEGNVQVELATYGARVISIRTPDRTGKVADIALHSDQLSSYVEDHNTYLGSVVGRYGNRIHKGHFSLDGTSYQLSVNDHDNLLHGGKVGFDQKVWSAKQVPNGVAFSLVSPDGDMGFPGTLHATVTYTLIQEAGEPALKIHYEATTDKPTVANLTNHTYFNLSGEPGSSILSEVVTLHASHYTEAGEGLIPTGKIPSVAGTPLDFRTPHTIGDRIHSDFAQLTAAGGYDHNFVIDGKAGTLRDAAEVYDPASGRTLTVLTTQPGVQFYTGNSLKGTFQGVNGIKYPSYSGFCLETQHYPDSPNHPDFPTTTLRPGETLNSTTIFKFGVKK